MDNLNKHTPTELLKMGNDISKEHSSLKEEIIQDTFKIEELEKEINEKIKKLKELEDKYVQIVEEIDKR